MMRRYGRPKPQAPVVFSADQIALRGGSGFGDAIYLQSIARHYLGKGKQVEVCSNWTDVFLPLKDKIKVSEFRRENINMVAHYTSRKRDPGSDQFRDCCLNAGIIETVPFDLGWTVQDHKSIEAIPAKKPVILVGLPRSPMGRHDGFGASVLPDCKIIQRAIDKLRKHAFLIQIGKGTPLFHFSGIHLNLANRTSVAETIDVASIAHGALGYCSFLVPLAESLHKPGLFVWSRRGLKDSLEFVRHITPQKVLHCPATSRAVIDDCTDAELSGAVDAFLEQARGCFALPRQVDCDRGQWAGVAAE